jgi:hypothetical protein
MSGITIFVLLTGLGAALVWGLGFRMSRGGQAIPHRHRGHGHHKAA